MLKEFTIFISYAWDMCVKKEEEKIKLKKKQRKNEKLFNFV